MTNKQVSVSVSCFTGLVCMCHGPLWLPIKNDEWLQLRTALPWIASQVLQNRGGYRHGLSGVKSFDITVGQRGVQCWSADVRACSQSLTYPGCLHQGSSWVGPRVCLPHSPPWRRWEQGKPVAMLLQTMVFLYVISEARLWFFLGAPLLDYNLWQTTEMVT